MNHPNSIAVAASGPPIVISTVTMFPELLLLLERMLVDFFPAPSVCTVPHRFCMSLAYITERYYIVYLELIVYQDPRKYVVLPSDATSYRSGRRQLTNSRVL